MNRRIAFGLVVSVLGGVALVACTSGPYTRPSSTAAAATAQVVMPTAQAAATQAAPTAQASATQVVAQISATVSATTPVRISNVETSSADSSVMIQNTSPTPVDLTGWQMQVGSASAALPGGMTVAPGQTVTLHTGSGTSTPTEVFLGPQAQNISANLQPGAQVVLQSPSGPVTAFNVPGA